MSIINIIDKELEDIRLYYINIKKINGNYLDYIIGQLDKDILKKYTIKHAFGNKIPLSSNDQVKYFITLYFTLKGIDHILKYDKITHKYNEELKIYMSDTITLTCDISELRVKGISKINPEKRFGLDEIDELVIYLSLQLKAFSI